MTGLPSVATLLAILPAILALCGPCTAQEIDQQAWIDRVIETDAAGDRRLAFRLGQDIAELPPDDGLAVVRAAWKQIRNVNTKQQIVKAWQFASPAPYRLRLHPRALDLHAFVFARDEPEVHAWLLAYLPAYAWRTFDDAEDALAWLTDREGAAAQDTAIACMRAWHEELEGDNVSLAEATALFAVLGEIGHPFRRNAELQNAARRIGIIDTLEMALKIEEFPTTTIAAIYGHLMSLEPDRYTMDGFQALTEKLTEIDLRRAEAKRRELEAAVRTVGNDDRKQWLLHAPPANAPEPAAGFGLLLVMPGGAGTVDFATFVRDTIRAAVGDAYIVAQLIAPPIDEGDDDAIVWPTEALRDDRVDFTIEPVADAIVESVRSEYKIDPERVFVMGWSSGGPPSYRLTMRRKTAFQGAFVAMSVFKPDLLPAPAHCAGRSFYILHSPQDFIAMRFPQDAARTLAAARARVKLETYEGGHGWHGDASAIIAKAMRWLEEK